MRGRRQHASHRVVTPIKRVLNAQERRLASRRRDISDPNMSDVGKRALLAAMNSTRKAAVLTGVNDRIVRAQRYRSVYDKITPY